MRRTARTCRTAAAAIRNGTSWATFFRCWTETVSFLRGGGQWVFIEGPWDLIIAHPPCTHLAVSGARWFPEKQKDFRQQKACVLFMQMMLARCDRVAVENPIGIMSSCYRKPDQIIQPYEYGETHRKATCLWLKGLRCLTPTNIVEPELITYVNKKGRTVTDDVIHWNTGSGCGKLRSKTFPGIAKAMAEQWG